VTHGICRNPQENPCKTRTRTHGCRFLWVWVRVNPKMPVGYLCPSLGDRETAMSLYANLARKAGDRIMVRGWWWKCQRQKEVEYSQSMSKARGHCEVSSWCNCHIPTFSTNGLVLAVLLVATALSCYRITCKCDRNVTSFFIHCIVLFTYGSTYHFQLFSIRSTY
jgi:hypothetical protein